MKMILRIVGTWLMGLALVLVIVDIAKSVAQSELLITSVGVLWSALSPNTYSTAYAGLEAQLQAIGAVQLTQTLFSVPAWGLFFVVGILLMLIGRRPRGEQFVTTH